MNKYLDYMANVFGFGTEYADLSEADDKWADTPGEMMELLKMKGLELGSYGDPGDSMFCLFEDGKLVLTAYVSTRGSLYQAGAYDGEKQYGASNLGFHAGFAEHPEPKGQWKEYQGYTCAKIAEDIWKEVLRYG